MLVFSDKMVGAERPGSIFAGIYNPPPLFSLTPLSLPRPPPPPTLLFTLQTSLILPES